MTTDDPIGDWLREAGRAMLPPDFETGLPTFDELIKRLQIGHTMTGGTMPTMGTWRTGRKVGRTIYVQLGADPSTSDVLVGMMDTAELARLVVDAVNALAHGDPPREEML